MTKLFKESKTIRTIPVIFTGSKSISLRGKPLAQVHRTGRGIQMVIVMINAASGFSFAETSCDLVEKLPTVRMVRKDLTEIATSVHFKEMEGWRPCISKMHSYLLFVVFLKGPFPRL